MQRSLESASVTAVLNNQLEQFSTRYEEQDVSTKLFRERNHDWKNHLLLIKAYSDSGDIAGLREYIAGISDCDELIFVKHTGNPAIDIIFNALSAKAANAGIDLNIASCLAYDVAINAVDICIVISNAVDNAYEACERISDIKKRIDIEIATDKTYLFFTISNTIQEIPRRMNGRFLTSKSDSTMHGIGLRSIQRIVDKYSGHSNATVKDGKFTLSCALKNIKMTDHTRKSRD
jgi:sensor histidine kinase YesM